MPNAPLGFCSTPGCRNRARGKCPDCRKVTVKAKDSRRGSRHERGYTNRWSEESKRHLALYPWCGQRAPDAYTDGWRGECYELGKRTVAQCTDHIRPPKGDLELFWEPRNWQALCKRCNVLKAVRYEGGFGRSDQGSAQ